MTIKRKKEIVLAVGMVCNSAWILNDIVEGVPHENSLSLAMFSLVLFGWVICKGEAWGLILS